MHQVEDLSVLKEAQHRNLAAPVTENSDVQAEVIEAHSPPVAAAWHRDHLDDPGREDNASDRTPSTSSSCRESFRTSSRPSIQGHEVWLHIYDIDNFTANLNRAVLHSANLGAYHAGIEVLGDEWFFAWGESDASGVFGIEPKKHQVHVYNQSIFLGLSPLSDYAIREVIADMMDNWPGNSYHPITRNCVDFAQELIKLLQCPESFPTWARGAVDAGKSPSLLPIMDFAWQMVKWWKKRSESGAESASQMNPEIVD